MKKVLFVIVIVMLMALVGCASTEESKKTVTEDKSLQRADINKVASTKILGKDDIPMPEWVIGKNISTEDIHYAIGQSDYPVERIAVNKAEDDARNQLAEWVNTLVKESSSGYLSVSGSIDELEKSEAYETVYNQNSEAVLSACTREHTWISKEGTVYVLMSIPVVNVLDQFGIRETKDTAKAADPATAGAAMKEAVNNL